MISMEDVEKLTALSRIELSLDEKRSLQKDVGAVLAYVSQIQEVVAEKELHNDTTDVRINTMREDNEPHESGLYTEVLLSSAPKREGNYVRVKKIL